MSQFGRALAQPNIDIICANSPQAKGRVERVHKTLQDRLVKELRLHDIADVEDEIHCEGRQLPYSLFDKNPVVSQGAIVEKKRLGAVLTVIQGAQAERDRARLASHNLTKRGKDRVLEKRRAAGLEPKPASAPAKAGSPPEDRLGTMMAYLKAKQDESKSRRKLLDSMAAVRRRLKLEAHPPA
jgi:hypothetical protein